MRFVLLVAALAACEENEDPAGADGGGLPPARAWLVGSAGTMLRLDGARLDRYPLDVDVDLRAIACRGALEAWAVGDRGVVVRTTNGGATWERVAIPTASDLVSVAVAHEAPVFVASSAGDVFMTADAGQTWTPWSAGGEVTDVATSHDGRVAVASRVDGVVARFEDGQVTHAVATAALALRSIAIAADGAHVVAVGDVGAIAESHDGGRAFGRPSAPAARDLFAVELTREGRALVVGGAGLTAQWVDGAVIERQGTFPTLRALHVEASGVGVAVGDDGVIVETTDGGASWRPAAVRANARLLGVDNLHGEPHL